MKIGKKTILILLSLMTVPAAIADVGYMMDWDGGMMPGYGGGLLWLFYLVIGSMIFSIIFWGTHKLMYPEKRRK